MVSLKSFKLINEGERDEASSSDWRDNTNQHRPASENYQPSFRSKASEGSKANDINKQQDANSRQHLEAMSANINLSEDSTTSKHEALSSNKMIQTPIMPPLNADELQIDDRKLMSNARGNSKAIVKVSLSDRQAANKENESDEQSVSPSTSSISIVVVNHDIQGGTRNATSDEDFTQDGSSNHSIDDLEDHEDNSSPKINRSILVKPVDGQLGDGSYFDSATGNAIDSGLLSPENLQLYTEAIKGNESRLPASADSRMAIPMNGEHFEIVWSNLSYKIEPKWYKKINFLDRIFSHFLPGQTIDNHSSATSTASSSAGMNDNQHQMHTSTNADSHLNSSLSAKQKSALDSIEIFTNLNGTIKSGQMTAVLGPSGK